MAGQVLLPEKASHALDAGRISGDHPDAIPEHGLARACPESSEFVDVATYPDRPETYGVGERLPSTEQSVRGEGVMQHRSPGIRGRFHPFEEPRIAEQHFRRARGSVSHDENRSDPRSANDQAPRRYAGASAQLETSTEDGRNSP
jgi:hypothetical protein